jgi:hypothetical protein
MLLSQGQGGLAACMQDSVSYTALAHPSRRPDLTCQRPVSLDTWGGVEEYPDVA